MPFLDQPGNLQASIEALRDHPYPLEAAPIASQVEALKTFQSPGTIRQRTLILAAHQDLVSPPENCYRLHQSIEKSHFQVLENTGHSCMLQTPDAFNQAVLDFLR